MKKILKHWITKIILMIVLILIYRAYMIRNFGTEEIFQTTSDPIIERLGENAEQKVDVIYFVRSYGNKWIKFKEMKHEEALSILKLFAETAKMDNFEMGAYKVSDRIRSIEVSQRGAYNKLLGLEGYKLAETASNRSESVGVFIKENQPNVILIYNYHNPKTR